MPNVELLKRTLHHIENNVALWDQREWITPAETRGGCGTAYCFAGWALKLAGADVDDQGYVRYESLPRETRCRLEPIDLLSGGAGADDVVYAPYAATVLLDIPDFLSGGRHLFDGHNTLNDLRAMVHQLCDESPEARA